MATIFDVAKEAGVSKSTVSRVINNDECVKKETRDAVNAVIKKLNYSPSFMAQAIRTRKTHTIAFMIPEYSNIYYGEMFRGVEDIALEHGYMVLVCNTERHAMNEVEYAQELLKRNIDGIIYNTYRIKDDMAEKRQPCFFLIITQPFLIGILVVHISYILRYFSLRRLYLKPFYIRLKQKCDSDDRKSKNLKIHHVVLSPITLFFL